LLEIVPLLALNIAVAEPAATVAVAGTVSAATLLDKATLAPPVGAAWFNVTVHVLVEFCPREVGLQVSEDTFTGMTRPMLAVAEVLL
jgi:hypothetical protein